VDPDVSPALFVETVFGQQAPEFWLYGITRIL
jgi:hypothetical protein